ncbi:MAG TPA: hypothetical protein VGJ97_12230 [Anaerolineaceae bacterium]
MHSPVSRILAKLEAPGRTQAVIDARRTGAASPFDEDGKSARGGAHANNKED